MTSKNVYCAVQPRTAKRLAIEIEQAEDAVPSRRAKERLQMWHDNEVRLVKAARQAAARDRCRQWWTRTPTNR